MLLQITLDAKHWFQAELLHRNHVVLIRTFFGFRCAAAMSVPAYTMRSSGLARSSDLSSDATSVIVGAVRLQ
jgi:hypothetical protein